MYYVYILKAKNDQNLYIGSTNDLRRRLAEHNDGKVDSTAPRGKFELLYYEAYKVEDDARRRESALKKRGQARARLKERLSASLQ